MKLSLAGIIKIALLVANAAAVAAGWLEAINPKYAGVAALVSAIILAVTKAIQDSPFDDEPVPPTEA